MDNGFYIKNAMFDNLIAYVKLICPNYNIHKALKNANLSADELSNRELFLDYTKIVKLLSLIAYELNLPLFSLMYARYSSETNKTLMDKMFPLLKTLDMVYAFAEEYVKNHTNAIEIERRFYDDRVFLHWKIKYIPKDDDIFQASLFLAYRIYQPLHKIISENFSCGQDVIIHLPSRYAPMLNGVENIFNVQHSSPTIIFKDEEHGVSFPKSYNEIVFNVKTKELFEIIEEISPINMTKSINSFSNKVYLIIENNIKMGFPCDLPSISRSFYMHPRTLQNKLSDEGNTFSSILEDVRKKLSTEMLSDEEKAIYLISSTLGFSDSAIFSRAFKMWYNLSPSQWRKQHKK